MDKIIKAVNNQQKTISSLEENQKRVINILKTMANTQKRILNMINGGI